MISVWSWINWLLWRSGLNWYFSRSYPNWFNMHASYVGDGNAKTAMLRSDIITWWKWCYSLRVCTLFSSRRLFNKDEYINLNTIKVDKIPHKIFEKSKGDSDYKIINRNLNNLLTANCMTWAITTSIWDQWNSEYFIESSTKCINCIAKWLVWSNMSSWTQ